MFSEESIMQILKDNTSYRIAYGKERDFNLLEVSEMNIIYVGYSTIYNKSPNRTVEYSFYNSHGEDLVQSFDVSIVCLRKDLPKIWRDSFAALIGKNPIPEEADRGGLTLAESGPMGFSNNAVWWLNRWNIGFPTVYTIV